MKAFKLREWHGIWWIVNLLYSHVVYTSVSILNCPVVKIDSQNSSMVSYKYTNDSVDGNNYSYAEMVHQW